MSPEVLHMRFSNAGAAEPSYIHEEAVIQPSPQVCSPCQRNGVVVVSVMKLYPIPSTN